MMIKNTIFSLKNEKYENRLFAQILALVTVPLVIMGIIAYWIYFNGEIRQNRQRVDSCCENIRMEYDNIMTSIKEYYLDASVNDDFLWLLDQKKTPYSQQSKVAAAQDLLRGSYFMMKYIQNYNFINVKEGWVLNNYGMFPYEDARNLQQVEAFLEEQKENALSVYWLNQMDVPSPYDTLAKESRLVDLSQELFVIKNQGHGGDLKYLLVVQLNMAELQRIMEKNKDLGFELLVLSDDKALVESSSEFLEYCGEYLKNEENEGAIRTTSKYEISIGSSQENRLTFVAGYEKAKAYREGAVFIWVSIAFAVILVLVIIAIRYLSILFSRPVRNLQSLVDSQNSQIKELFLSSMLKGREGLTDQRIQEMLSKFGMEPWPVYRLLVMAVKNTESDTSVEELETEILMKIPDDIRELIFAAPVRRERIMVFLMGGEEEILLDGKAAVFYKKMKDYVWEEFHELVATGISRPFQNLKNTESAYEECMEALHNRQNQNREHSTLVLYDDYSLRNRGRNVYDIVVETELVNAIENGNEEEAGRLLEMTLERMERREVVGIERNVYVTRLLTAMMAVPQNKGILLDEVFGDENYADISQAGKIYDTKKLVKYLKEEIVHPLTEAIQSRGSESDLEISRQVLEMIKESSGTVSLSDCSERLNYHPNHIGKILKRDTGKTFSELVNEERMALAKYMLLTTDYSIAEISEKLQYNNVQNFIRFFKSNAQITPAAFRKAHK